MTPNFTNGQKSLMREMARAIIDEFIDKKIIVTTLGGGGGTEGGSGGGEGRGAPDGAHPDEASRPERPCDHQRHRTSVGCLPGHFFLSPEGELT